MFTGIVQATGKVLSVNGARLTVDAGSFDKDEAFVLGESIAVNGVCLTVVDWEGGLQFDVSEETHSKTTLGFLKQGTVVNLERAMKASDRFGGHFVQGHVDCTGTFMGVSSAHGTWHMTFDVGQENTKYLVDKGSICLDGVSLTVTRPEDGEFVVAVIPHTWEHTNLSALDAGDKINVEFDVLVKTVDRLLAFRD